MVKSTTNAKTFRNKSGSVPVFHQKNGQNYNSYLSAGHEARQCEFENKKVTRVGQIEK